MAKTNLCIIGLAKYFTDNICKSLSSKLDMFYANVQDIVEFELFDLNQIEEVCGKEFLLKEQTSIVKRICSYENTLININYSELNDENILDSIRSSCLLIYIRIDKDRFKKEQDNDNFNHNEKIINIDLFNDRDFICKNIAEIVVNCNDLNEDNVVELILKEMINYYN